MAKIALYDPEGFALAEQALDDFFPPLEYIASHSSGSRIRNKYGPKYFVSKYEISMAFMAAENFEDPNSISARMIQARFSNYGRFSCMAMLEFASEADNAAAGTSQPLSARINNPPNYNSPWDRNWLLYFATIFTESMKKEVGPAANLLEVNVMQFWKEQCEEPAAYRTPVPNSMWMADPERLGTTDAFDTSVQVRDFAPLVSFGSLRQLRAADGAAREEWPEDATTSTMFVEDFESGGGVGGGAGSPGGFSFSNYGRRRMDADSNAPNSSTSSTPSTPSTSSIDDWAQHGFQYRDGNVSIATGPLPTPRHRGRKLLMFMIIKTLLKKSLGVAKSYMKKKAKGFIGELLGIADIFEPKPYQEMEKEFEFDSPDTPRPHFFYDNLARRRNIAKNLLRDVFCNPDYKLTIEQVVGDPPPHAFTDAIFDSSTAKRPRDMMVPGTLRGGDVHGGFEANGPGGETPSYSDTTTQSWVYVTSSDDERVPVGFHRLADLRVWPEISCNRIKAQPCGSVVNSGAGETSSWLSLAWFNVLFSSSFGRRQLDSTTGEEITYFKINDDESYVEPTTPTFNTGIEALLGARCSSYLASNGIDGATACVGAGTKWFNSEDAAYSGCDKGRLELVDTSVYEPLGLYLSRFAPPTPPPAPPPKPPPPLPPAPPPPTPPPSPPRFATREFALGFAAKMMRDFCDS